MSKRDELLESCLARMAAGDSVAACLADHPEDAEWLRPFLTAAHQLQTLPSQQPRPAADKAIQLRLRQAARQSATADRAGAPRLRRLPSHFMEDIMKNFSRFLFKWLPRVVVGGTAVALLIIFITQFASPLPFLSGPDTEPAVESLPANVTTVGDTTITLEADLTADPGEVPLYRAFAQPIPPTPSEALAWAQEFGLPDPELYRSPNDNDPVLHVLGSDGQRLTFQNHGGFGGIFYGNSVASMTDGDPLPFAEATEIAVTFLRDHNMLPDAYQVESEFGYSGSTQQILIQPEVEGGVIGGNAPGATLHVSVNAAGQVVHAILNPLVLETAGTTTVISAQTAYNNLLDNTNVMGSTYSTMPVDGEAYRTYQPPPPTWEIGQTVDLVGYLNALIHVQTGDLRVELTGSDQGAYHLSGLSGDNLTALSEQSQLGGVRIQGTITAQDSPIIWQVSVENWEAVGIDNFSAPCLIGTLTRTGEVARFHSEDGAEYGLPHAPEDIGVGELMEICAASAEPGDDLVWFSIRMPPYGDGPPPGGVVTEQMVVEEVMEVAVTRVVVEEVEVVGGFGIAEAVPLPEPTAVFIEPTNPYEIGDEVELTGIIQLYRIINEEGEERLEATFRNDGDQGEASYPFTYPLLAAPELLAGMAEFNELHIRVYGRIVPPPETELFFMPNEEHAIEVDRFDRPWPDEKMMQFLGHFNIEEIEGQQVLLFTDHATSQQYVINPPDLPLEAYEHDTALQEDQVLLTGIVHPINTFGGLPLLERRGMSTGPDIAQATDVSQFPLEEYETIPVINEAEMRRHDGLAGVLHGEVVIERAELMYPYQPQQPMFGSSDEEPAPQLLEPVWAFYGRSADGREQFIIHVRATADIE